MLALLIFAAPASAFASADTVRTEFIGLTMQAFQTVAREAALRNDAATLIAYVKSLGRSSLVDYALVVSSGGVVVAHTDRRRIGLADTDPMTANALTNRDLNGLRLEDFKNQKGETVFDASLPVASTSTFFGAIRIGFKGMK